jgi:1-deoxy-D-xylulose-5-phosphate reductoisomerase
MEVVPQVNTRDRRLLAVLGSTGSIGRQTLDVVRAYPDRFEVVALAARGNVDLLAAQAREFQPALTVLTGDDPAALQRLRAALPERLVIQGGIDGLTTAATLPEVEMVVAATSGLVGVLPTIAAIHAGKTIALANKETLVMAGHLVMPLARELGVEILPVDSEHNALWQCLRGEDPASVRRLLITASGGPFRRLALEQMRGVTPDQALNHPTWRMGPKVTIDSATLMNKGLEVIEAHWLYDMPYERVTVVVHPQSVIHSMVEYVDDSIKMQASIPSMHLPIQYALSYPERLERAGTPLALPLEWGQVAKLDFEDADMERFPCLKLAYDAGKAGGSAPAVLVGADETAVDLFLRGAIHLTDIATIVGETLERHNFSANPSVEEVGAVSAWAQEEARRVAERITGAALPAAGTDH